MRSSIIPLFCGVFTLAILSDSLSAQVIQLPTFRVFNVRTSVSVPDGGTISLGGVNRSATGRVSRGIPGLPGPLTNNRGIGRNSGSTRAAASAKIIIMSELEAEVLAEARRRQAKATHSDPNGSPAVQHQADFITRNIGRSRKR